MPDDLNASRLHLGAAYYPEHWPEARWQEDIRLMHEAGFTVARMAEFAWTTLEPAESEFHFEWLERIIAMLAEAGIKSVLGTPTASPPAWLVSLYPQILAVDEDGQKVQLGNRCHYCVNSPEFHAAVQRIVHALAERFGPNPNVIGWQLDNEYNRVCYCDHCQHRFREYLQEQFETLDALNEHWSTRYWSQTYSDWNQIPMPIGGHNPGLMLAFKRFVTESYRRYQKIQLKELRPYLPEGVWVTHNFMGWYDGYDHYKISADLDMASWDYYVGAGRHDYQAGAMLHDHAYGLKRRGFWIMETQPGSVNWSAANTVLEKGEGRTMAWQAVAHGAEAVLYWQWRMALNGQEQYHGSLIDQSGQPRPFYEEAKQIGQEFARASDLLAGSHRQARIAMLYSYESRWSLDWQRHHQDFDYMKHFLHYYRPIATANLPVDILDAEAIKHADQLKGYRLVIAPALALVPDELVGIFTTYLDRGGHLVLTLRTGVKDRFNALLPSRPPGPLADMVGMEVEEYYALDTPAPIKGNWFEGTVQIWAERLKQLPYKIPQVIARYKPYNGWLDDKYAISVRSHNMGLVYYVGAYLDDASQAKLIDRFLRTATLKPFVTPEGVELVVRLNPAGEEIYFIINHNPQTQTIWTPWPARERLSETLVDGELILPPYSVFVLTEQPISES